MRPHRIAKKEGHPGVKAAIAHIADDSLFLSALTIGEIAKGIALLATGKKKQWLTSWLTSLETQFTDRILPVELQTAKLWGDLAAISQKSGISVPAVDGLIAATALQHGLHIMTRNTRHFISSGVVIIDPWQANK